MLIALPNAFGDAATNMAIDAALLESIPAGLAAFRHYGWLEPSATFGYAQRYQQVVSELASSDEQAKPTQTSGETSARTTACRRLTGGGIVDHRNDWTYALVLNATLSAASIPATTLYQQIHNAISLSLAALQIESLLAPCPKACPSPQPARPEPVKQASLIPHPVSHIPPLASRIPHPASQCFVTPAANDVLRPDGRKIAGAAMKRNRHGLLIQGSLDRGALPEDFDYANFQQELIAKLATELKLPIGELEDIRPLFNGERIQREKERFTSEAWNLKR